MAFIMDGFKGDSYDHKYKTKDILKRIWQLFSDKKKKVLIAIISLILSTAIGTIIPLILSEVLDTFDSSSSMYIVCVFVIGFTVFNVLSWIISYIQKICTKGALLEVNRDLQNRCFVSSITKDMSFFDQNDSARVISRITGDTESLANVVDLMVTFFKDVLTFVVLITVTIFKSPKMTLVLLAFIPVIVLATFIFRKIAKVVSSQLFKAIAQVNQEIKECISGITVTKNFCKEDYMYGKFVNTNTAVFKTNIKQGLVFSGILPAMSLLSALGTFAIAFFGSHEVLEGNMSHGELYLFIQAVSLLWNPITSIANFFGQFQEGLAAAERIFALIDAGSKITQTDDKKVDDIKGNIRFDHLIFYYKNGENVLDDFSLNIREGEKIALVGHTGSGKSTITQLILRFYEYQKGSLLIDDKDIREFNLADYRKNIGYVSQTPFLFSGTVLDNILYGADDKTVEDAVSAANQIGNGHWLDYLPNGIHTEVGERGSKISLGQRQLVAIARVILRKPSILIFDEATANIDPITEHYIQEALKSIMDGRTSIMIAHRLTTIRNVDRIIALQKGKIIEEGSHEILLQKDGYYKELYNKYFKYQSMESIS